MCPDSIITDYLGLLIFFLALSMQGLLLHDKVHGPEKNRTVPTHIKMERKGKL